MAPKRTRPPDPDRMNDVRSMWADISLTAFRDVTGTDRQDSLADLLCDLMHWCDRNRTSFDAQLRRAQMHYTFETQTLQD